MTCKDTRTPFNLHNLRFTAFDGGNNWKKIDTLDEKVQNLTINPNDGTLFAITTGNPNKILRSEDQGETWENVSIENTYVRNIMFEPFKVYALTLSNNIYHSFDGGNNWKKIDTLDEKVQNLTINSNDGTLFAITTGNPNKILRSQDQGETWENVSIENTYVRNIMFDSVNDTLLVTTSNGLFYQAMENRNWIQIRTSSPIPFVHEMSVDPQKGTLYIGTSVGLFRLRTFGSYWEQLSLVGNDVYSIAFEKTGVIYLGTNNGVLSTVDEGKSFLNIGLEGRVVKSLEIEPISGSLIAGTDKGVFASTGEDINWKSLGLDEYSIDQIIVDPINRRIITKISSNIFFQFNIDTQRWIQINLLNLNPMDETNFLDGTDSIPSLVYTKDYLSAILLPYNVLVPIAEGDLINLGAESIYSIEGNLVEFVSFDQRNDKIYRSRLDIHFLLNSQSKPSLISKGIALNINYFLTRFYSNIRYSTEPNQLIAQGIIYLLLTLAIVFAGTYLFWGVPFQIPAKTVWEFSFLRFKKTSNELIPELEISWSKWSAYIRRILFWLGEVNPADLRGVPKPYQSWALRRYNSEFSNIQLVTINDDVLHLLAGGRPAHWLRLWGVCAREFYNKSFFTPLMKGAIDEMVKILSEAMGLRISIFIDFGQMRAYLVEAPNLRLNVPRQFPLVFLAERRPNNDTITMLTECINQLRSSAYFALIIPIEPFQGDVDINSELIRWVKVSARLNDFTVLSQNKVLDILSAREPISTFVDEIKTQVDLKTISPFVDSGPCPPQMFFGREIEIKQIFEGIDRNDFAIVGNRKAGKTSILNRVYNDLLSNATYLPLLINCQTVYNENDFYREFEDKSKRKLSEYSARGYELAVKEFRQEGKLLVFLIDEVDELLHSDYQNRQHLSGTWRKHSQEDICHFVFAGTRILAQRLYDPRSVFFNFPQRMTLNYLPEETANLVISEPMALLGLILEPKEELLKEIYKLTSGHPNLLQTVGRRLVDRASDKGTRVITLEDCLSVEEDTEFTDFYISVIWGLAHPLEKLITLIITSNVFSLEDLESDFSVHGIPYDEKQVEEALRMLEIYAIIKRRKNSYEINPKTFRKIIDQNRNIGRLIQSELRDLNTQWST